MRNGRSKLAALAAIPLLAMACSNGDSDDTGAASTTDETLSGSLTGAGASFPDPLFQDWMYTYTNEVQPETSINYQSVGSGAGIEQFLEQTVDFGSSERYLTDEDLATAADTRGCEALQFPVVFGSVVIAFSNPDLEGLVLDSEAIAGIFAGEITSYTDPAIADLNPDMDLPDDEIVPVHRSDSSGTTEVFTHYLSHEVDWWADEYGSGSEIDWADGLVGGQQNDGVAQGISQNPGGVGYVNQAYVDEAGLYAATLINEDGNEVEPTLESTTAASEEAEIPDDFRFSIEDIGGEGYPIAGTNWIFTYTCGYDEATADTLIDFWTWALTDETAEEAVATLGYAPLGDELKDRVLAEIERTNSENGGGDTDGGDDDAEEDTDEGASDEE